MVCRGLTSGAWSSCVPARLNNLNRLRPHLHRSLPPRLNRILTTWWYGGLQMRVPPGAQAAQVKIDGWVNDGPAGTIVRLVVRSARRQVVTVTSGSYAGRHGGTDDEYV
jgi:hypothetical protein